MPPCGNGSADGASLCSVTLIMRYCLIRDYSHKVEPSQSAS